MRPGDEGTHWVVSIMGGSDRKGRWRVGRTCTVVNVMGGSDLDLNDAEFAADVVEMRVFSLMGGSDIWIPDGLDVEVSEFAFMGGNEIRIREAAPGRRRPAAAAEADLDHGRHDRPPRPQEVARASGGWSASSSGTSGTSACRAHVNCGWVGVWVAPVRGDGFRPVRATHESTVRKASVADAFRTVDLPLVRTGRKPSGSPLRPTPPPPHPAAVDVSPAGAQSTSGNRAAGRHVLLDRRAQPDERDLAARLADRHAPRDLHEVVEDRPLDGRARAHHRAGEHDGVAHDGALLDHRAAADHRALDGPADRGGGGEHALLDARAREHARASRGGRRRA